MYELDVDATSTDELRLLAQRLIRTWTGEALALAPDDDERVDVHCHIGRDSDGSSIQTGQLLAQLDAAAMHHATVIALHQPDGYARENQRMREVAAASGGRLHALHRCDPRATDPAVDARTGLEAGAVGLKWHPRAEHFAMHDRLAESTAQIAHDAGVPILIHAGRGMDRLGEGVVELARTYSNAIFLLAHAGISDLGWIVDATRDCPNVVFDTSWWRPTDIAVLLATCEPERVMHASDPPYGTAPFGAQMSLRIARACGWGDDAVAALMGGNARRIFGIGASEGSQVTSMTAPHDAHMPEEEPAMRRAGELLAAAMHVSFGKGDTGEVFDLACSALDVHRSSSSYDEACLLQRAVRMGQALIDRTAAGSAEDGHPTFLDWTEERRVGVELLLCTLVHLATPSLAISGIDRAG